MSETGPQSPLGDKLSEQELCPDDLLADQEAAFARDIERLHSRVSEFIEIDCPACGSSRSHFHFDKYRFRFLQCEDCETIFMSPRPSPTVMADYYSNSENYAYWATHIFPSTEAARREKIHKPWLQRVIGYCDRFNVEKGTLLEVGPGFGTFSELVVRSGCFVQCIAIEPTPEMASACRDRGIQVIERRIEDVNTQEVGYVDVLVAFEVIEHLFDPTVFLAQCRRLVGVGGLLVLSCPNGLGFDIEMLGSRALAVDAEHVNLFNPRALSELLARSGFNVVDVSTPGRLDAELVRDAALKGHIDLHGNPFLERVLVGEWERVGWSFQQFLATNGLSSHMWVAAIRA
jgi:2-polyprenyl-3-methyl-5-hydroxy-6-metoxy-1,4-benzoquinol methylase